MRKLAMLEDNYVLGATCSQIMANTKVMVFVYNLLFHTFVESFKAASCKSFKLMPRLQIFKTVSQLHSQAHILRTIKVLFKYLLPYSESLIHTSWCHDCLDIIHKSFLPQKIVFGCPPKAILSLSGTHIHLMSVCAHTWCRSVWQHNCVIKATTREWFELQDEQVITLRVAPQKTQVRCSLGAKIYHTVYCFPCQIGRKLQLCLLAQTNHNTHNHTPTYLSPTKTKTLCCTPMFP